MQQLAPEPATAPPAHPAAPDLTAGLRQLVQQNGRRWQLVIAIEAVSLAVAAPLAYLWLVFFLDNLLHLPALGRLLAAVGFLGGVAWAVRLLAQHWRALRLSEDEVALAIERRTPGQVHNRLINAVQLARRAAPEHRALAEAVVQENCERLRAMHLEGAARLRPALCCLAVAIALVGVGIAYWLWQPDRLTNAAARIFNPLADIDPLYRTRLEVEPGDMEAAGDATVRVTISGERPAALALLRRQDGKLTVEEIPVPAGDGPVTYTFRDVSREFTYAVRGGDFTTRFYRVTVPQRAALARVRVTYHYPAYTGLPAKTVETSGGDLEALQGTQAEVTFLFDRPVDRARLLLNLPAAKGQAAPRALTRQADGKEHRGEIRFEDVTGYRLEIAQADRPPQRSQPFAVRILKDQPPKLELIGLEPRMEVQPDAVVPLQIAATDDFGLEKVGLFHRRAVRQEQGNDENWRPVAEWPGQRRTALRLTHDLMLAGLALAEGDRVELALRAVDTDPLRKGAWTTGAIYELSVGGEGVALQLRYEQILRSETEIKALLKAEQDLLAKLVPWLGKLDGGGDLRWDDPKNVDALHAAVKTLGKEQEKVRQSASRTAQAMPGEAGNVRIAVGLLADTEMARLLRILEAVPGREQPQAKRAALADGRLTLERTARSLEELQEQYAAFRSDWELSHMIPFTKMLAQRQAKMRDQSRAHAARGAGKAETFQRQSMARRQQKMLDLCPLIQPAFTGLGARLQEQETILADAFRAGAATLAGDDLQRPLRQAAEDAGAGRWDGAARQQTTAADALNDLHARLRQAQGEAARKALAALKDRAKSDLQAQKELEKLVAGSGDAHVKDFPDGMKLEDMQRIWEVAGAKRRPGADKEEEPDFKNVPMDDVDRKKIELEKDSGVRQDTSLLTLGKVAEKTAVMGLYKGKDRNKVKPFIQEKFDDLVGKLLDEADEMHKKYQSLNLSTNQNNNDPGDIGKIGGKLNSTGAVAATGNKKPPTLESGGVARTGRQGARAYGMVADQDTYNRKGRDQALEGQQEIADQAGKNKMKSTDENQKDTSTGVGGKKIESTDSHFSLHDAGKWKDEYTKRMEKPQQKHFIVERQGDRIDPKVAAALRDMTSKQEQIIERLKSIKKELRNLYLPTEHLDDLAAALQTNLESLKERPDGEFFRLQLQTLDRLRGALRVFRGASAGLQPSLPRERALRGRVLDEPARQPIPGYEEAVRQYYLRLATQ